MNNSSFLANLLSARSFVHCLAVIGFFTVLACIGEYMHKPVRWFIIDQDSLSERLIAEDGPLVEGIVSGSWPWEKSPRFWLRFKDGKWEATWIADLRKIEWSEASEWMLKNPDFSRSSSDSL